MSSIPMTLRNKKQYSDEIREFVLEQITRGGQRIKLYTPSIGPILPFFSFRTLAHDPIHRIFTGSTLVKRPPKSVSGE